MELNFFVRQIQSSDEIGLFKLRNNPEIYKWSWSASTVDATSHKKWIQARLMSFREITLVAESSGSVIGTAYLSDLTKEMAEVSIRVQGAYSNRGVGKLLLQELIEQAMDLGLSTLHARIHRDNSDSIRFFESANFKMFSMNNNSSEIADNADFFTYALELP